MIMLLLGLEYLHNNWILHRVNIELISLEEQILFLLFRI
jgi:hypothetical protein